MLKKECYNQCREVKFKTEIYFRFLKQNIVNKWYEYVLISACCILLF